MSEEGILIFGGIYVTVRENLSPYYKYKTTCLTYKYPVTYSYKLKPSKVLDIAVSESNPLFCIV